MCVRYNEGVRCSEVSVNGGSTVIQSRINLLKLSNCHIFYNVLSK